MSQIKKYATELAVYLTDIANAQQAVKDYLASAKDAGIDPKALRKVAREIIMESDKRAKLYDDEDQLSLFRTEVGLTQGFAEAAE
jgi:uncharacterized protein (UPF0335 family)